MYDALTRTIHAHSGPRASGRTQIMIDALREGAVVVCTPGHEHDLRERIQKRGLTNVRVVPLAPGHNESLRGWTNASFDHYWIQRHFTAVINEAQHAIEQASRDTRWRDDNNNG